MGTPSTVARQTESGVESIACSYDGDLVGATLLRHFNSDELARELIALGDCSSIARSESIADVAAYYRDRGEDWADVQPQRNPDMASAEENGIGTYFFFWTGTEWQAYVSGSRAYIEEMKY